jgi:5-carboxymethyl-2-hydroxymuconate isomerase
MPHTILEYSAGAIPRSVTATAKSDFFRELHRELAETRIVELIRLKGRSLERADFLIGDGAAASGFVFLQLALLSGRSSADRIRLRDIASAVLERWLKRWGVPAGTSVTIEVREIDAATHQKIPF